MNKNIKDILNLLDYDSENFNYYGDDSINIIGVKNIFQCEKSHISFITSDSYLQYIKKGSVVVCNIDNNITNLVKEGYNFITTTNPRYIFAMILEIFKDHYPDEKIQLGKNFKVGENCVFKNCIIGDNVTIHSGTIVGEDGFGYVRNSNGTKIIKFPHYGKVIIENNVHIHANCCIDRGSLSDTIIRSNVKIDNMVHIAHNVEIDENTFIITQSMIGGGTKIGKNCWISPGCSIIDGITIADNTYIGIGTNVIKSILEPNQTWVGNPARRIK